MVSTAWAIMGDFNPMVESSEKRGGAKFNQSPAADFRDCIRDCSLIDTGIVGPRFTWFRKNLKERLDRCLANADWFSTFPDSSTIHVERLKSDHRPLLVRIRSTVRYDVCPRPFRFNAAWFGHENFTDFLDQSWKRGRDLCFSLQDFKEHCITWNTEVFGHIFKRKRHLEKRLRQLELRTQQGDSGIWMREEDLVRRELERILWQEHMLWLQKSRMQWIKDGDRNTKFFHLSTLCRRKANWIQGLKLDDGSWSYDDAELKKMAVAYFENLFKAGRPMSLDLPSTSFTNPHYKKIRLFVADKFTVCRGYNREKPYHSRMRLPRQTRPIQPALIAEMAFRDKQDASRIN
ncbi:hypothetical protein LINPERHAP2_LOCUS413 [Linum perenne]